MDTWLEIEHNTGATYKNTPLAYKAAVFREWIEEVLEYLHALWFNFYGNKDGRDFHIKYISEQVARSPLIILAEEVPKEPPLHR